MLGRGGTAGLALEEPPKSRSEPSDDVVAQHLNPKPSTLNLRAHLRDLSADEEAIVQCVELLALGQLVRRADERH